MRINVYAEEITNEVRRIAKTATQTGGESRTFYGVGFYLASPDVLHHTIDDDDRSAITLWVPWTAAGGHDFGHVRTTLMRMLAALDNAEEDERRRSAAAVVTQ